MSEATTYRRAEGLSPSLAPDPYQQTTSYDVWNNSSRTGYLYGGGPFGDDGAYVNNRHHEWYYDADGNVTNSLTYHNTIDAAGKQVHVVSGLQTVGDGTTQFPIQPAIDITQGYDGDGRPRSRVQIARQNIYDDTNQNHPLVQVLEDTQASYYVTSSVLGGAQVMELNPNGQKNSIWIYAGGERIAKEEGGSVSFEHHNPATGSWVTTLGHPSYRTATREERDPVGAETPISNPYPLTPNYVDNKWGEPLFIDGSDPFDYNSGQTIDGLPVSSSEFARRTKDGSAGAGLFLNGKQVGFLDLTGGSSLSHITAVFDVFRSGQRTPNPDNWLYMGSFAVDFTMPDVGNPAKPQRPQKYTQPGDPRAVPNRKLNNREERVLESFFTRITKRDDCGHFIEELLATAASIHTANQMISDDIGSLFQSVATGGGFYVAPTAAYSTPDGDIQDGTQAIYIGTHPDFSPDPRNYSPGVYRRASTAYLTLTYRQMAQTVIHELLHVAGLNDRALADAVAARRGEKVSFANNWDGTIAASKYWDAELVKHCH